MAAKYGLLLVGIGMGDIHSMTTSALNAVQNADLRILESYTAKWNDDDMLKLKQEVLVLNKLALLWGEAQKKFAYC